jgi:hypothetical protein
LLTADVLTGRVVMLRFTVIKYNYCELLYFVQVALVLHQTVYLMTYQSPTSRTQCIMKKRTLAATAEKVGNVIDILLAPPIQAPFLQSSRTSLEL